MTNITFTPEHYVAAISDFYPVPITFNLLLESVANNINCGRGMDRYLCQQLRSAGIDDARIAMLLYHSPLLTYQEQMGNMDDKTRNAYIDMLLREKK